MNLATIKELRGIPIGQVLTFENGATRGITATNPIRLLGADPYRVSVTLSTTTASVITVLRFGESAGPNLFYLPFNGVPLVITDESQPGAAGMPLWVGAASSGVLVSALYTRLIV